MDLPFSFTFYRWLLGQESCLTIGDLRYVNPELYVTIRKMQEIVRERDEILHNNDISEEEKIELVNVIYYSLFNISITFYFRLKNLTMMVAQLKI